MSSTPKAAPGKGEGGAEANGGMSAVTRSQSELTVVVPLLTQNQSTADGPVKGMTHSLTLPSGMDDLMKRSSSGRTIVLEEFTPQRNYFRSNTRDYDLMKRSSSGRTIVLEEFTPQRNYFRSNTRDSNTTDWQMSLETFTSKQRGKPTEDKKLPKNIKRYYKQQDELIAAYKELQKDDVSDMRSAEQGTDARDRRKQASILAKVSLVANLLLLVGKAVAAGLTGSLSVITSVIDSLVDLVSGSLMWWSNRAMKHRDPYLYPQGRTKLEPIAIVVLSVIMSLASVAMIRQALEKIAAYAMYDLQPADRHNETAVFCLTISEMVDFVHLDGRTGPVFDIISIVICIATIVTKLILFLVCRRIRVSSVQALAQDHRNDVISNTAAIACGLIGYKLWKYADPIGAIVISLYIIVSWFKTGNEQIKMLTGYSARPDFLKRLTWIALNHHEKIELIDTVRAFHFGNNFLVEVDIVLPADMNLRDAHNIGESLQCRLEKLEEVERAFVHLDYEVEHHPDTEHKVV